MRKLAGLAVTVSVLAFGAAVAAAEEITSPMGQKQAFSAKGTPKQASKSGASQRSARKATALDLSLTTSRADGGKASPPTKLTMRFPKGYVFNAKRFLQCVSPQIALTCPRGAKVGSGTLQLDSVPAAMATMFQAPPFGTLPTLPINVPVTVYNGQIKGGKPKLLLYATYGSGGPLFEWRLEVSSALKRAPQGPYGYALDIPLPVIPAVPDILTGKPVPNVAITKLQLRLQARTRYKRQVKLPRRCYKGKRIRKECLDKLRPTRILTSYVENPPRCNGSWKFRAEVSYESAETVSPTASARCAK